MERNDQQKFLLATYLNVVLEESDEESSESDSEYIINLIRNNCERVPKVRCRNYIENVVWQYTESDFKSHFR